MILQILNRSSSKSQGESTIDLVQSLIECQKITELIFENRLNEALKKTKEQYVKSFIIQSILYFYREKRSLYHSLCHSSIRFMQAGMTFNQV
jgi:hypothetical protein